MANLCFGVGIEEEGAVKIRRADKRGTRSLSWGQSEGRANLKSSMIMSHGHHKDDLLGRMQRVGMQDYHVKRHMGDYELRAISLILPEAEVRKTPGERRAQHLEIPSKAPPRRFKLSTNFKVKDALNDMQVRINDVERMIKKKSRKSILDRFESQKSTSIGSDDSKILLSSDPMDTSCSTILAPSPPAKSLTCLSSPGNYGAFLKRERIYDQVTKSSSTFLRPESIISSEEAFSSEVNVDPQKFPRAPTSAHTHTHNHPTPFASVHTPRSSSPKNISSHTRRPPESQEAIPADRPTSPPIRLPHVPFDSLRASSGESVKAASGNAEWGEIENGKHSAGAGYQDGPPLRKVNRVEGTMRADSDSAIQDRSQLRILTRGTAQLRPEQAAQSPESSQGLQKPAACVETGSTRDSHISSVAGKLSSSYDAHMGDDACRNSSNESPRVCSSDGGRYAAILRGSSTPVSCCDPSSHQPRQASMQHEKSIRPRTCPRAHTNTNSSGLPFPSPLSYQLLNDWHHFSAEREAKLAVTQYLQKRRDFRCSQLLG